KLPPAFDIQGHEIPQPGDPLGELGRSVRQLRDPDYYDEYADEPQHHPNPGPVWPYGLTFDLLVGAGAVWLTARQLRTPAARLPRCGCRGAMSPGRRPARCVPTTPHRTARPAIDPRRSARASPVSCKAFRSAAPVP